MVCFVGLRNVWKTGVRKALGIKELRDCVFEVGWAFILDDNSKGNRCQGVFTLQVIRMERAEDASG